MTFDGDAPYASLVCPRCDIAGKVPPCRAVYRYVVHGESQHVGFTCGHRFKKYVGGQWEPIRERR